MGRLPEIDPQPVPVAEDGLELVQTAGQRSVGIGAGDGLDGARRGGQGEALGGGEPAGPGQLGTEVGHHLLLVDHDLHQLVRCVRGQAATGGQLQVGDQLVGTDAEPLGQLGHRCPSLAGQPGEDGEEAVQPVAGVGARRHLAGHR